MVWNLGVLTCGYCAFCRLNSLEWQLARRKRVDVAKVMLANIKSGRVKASRSKIAREIAQLKIFQAQNTPEKLRRLETANIDRLADCAKALASLATLEIMELTLRDSKYE